MGHHRKDRLASAVRDVVAEAIARELNDPRITSLTSVTRVELSGDLQIAKVFISVMGTPGGERAALAGLRHASGHLQRLLSSHLQIRHCPELRFEVDASLKLAAETQRIIAESLREDESRAAARSGGSGTDPSQSLDGVGG